jgi:hypothetical protein
VSPKIQRIIGWVLSGLLAAFLLFSASGKLLGLMPKDAQEEMLSHLGWTADGMSIVGVIEVIITVLFVIPRTGFLGAILITGYMGGAIATHVRVGDAPTFQVVFAVVPWVAIALRQPVLWRLAVGANPCPPPPPSTE